MDIVIGIVKQHLGSWTIRLGVVAGILVALGQFLPAAQAFVHSVWPAGDAYLVVASMWVGRCVGFVRQIQAAAGADTGQASGV